MGEFLGALVAIPSIRRLRIVGPYEDGVVDYCDRRLLQHIP